MTVAITGASGHYGRMLTGLLLERIAPSELILITRSPQALAGRLPPGVRVRYGDFDKPQTLREAFAGATRALIISTLSVGRRREQHRRAIEAACAAGVRHLVYTSSVGIHPHSPAIVIRDHLETEEILRGCGAAFTILRDAQYAEVMATMLAPMALASGKWFASAGDGGMAFVAKRDCVESAAAVLTRPGHEGAVYEITGPEIYSFRDACTLAAELGGRPIEYIIVSDAEKQAQFDAAGIPRHYVEGMESEATGAWSSDDMVSYERAIREGYFSVCSRHVQLITGRPALSLREVFLANSAALGA